MLDLAYRYFSTNILKLWFIGLWMVQNKVLDVGYDLIKISLYLNQFWGKPATFAAT